MKSIIKLHFFIEYIWRGRYMTEKEFRKLSRKQLLELLLEQTKRADSLQEELEECKKQLNDRNIAFSECGTLAEACLKLNGIFEVAQKAADQYVENIKNSYSNKNLNQSGTEDE